MVGSEIIGEYRLMGFNDLRTMVGSRNIDLYRFVSTYIARLPIVKAREGTSIYPRINRNPRYQYLERTNINSENENFPVCRQMTVKSLVRD